MKSFFEILKIFLPALTTGLFGFITAKYSYSKNVPVEKMEIAYNRIY